MRSTDTTTVFCIRSLITKPLALFSTLCVHAHLSDSLGAFSRKIVSTRAKSRLVSRSFIGFSSRLVARLSFKLPISSRNEAAFPGEVFGAHIRAIL